MPFWDPVTGDYVNDPLLGDQLMAPAFPEKPLAAPAAPVFDPNQVVDPPPQVVAPVSAVPQQVAPVTAPGVSTRVGNRSSVDVYQSGVNLGKAQQIADFSSKMGRAYAPVARQAADLAKAEQESITEQTRLQQEAVDVNKAAKEQQLARDTALDTEYETKRKVYEDAIKIGHAKATEAENAARAKHEAAFQQWASMKVEPDRLTRDNGIGVAMVAFADGFLKARGVNSDAMATLNTRINRDIEAQKYAIEHQGNVTEGFKRLYDIARAHTQSEDQFNTLMYEGYVRSGINYLERQKALATSKVEIAALEASKKQLEASMHAARAEAQSRSLQNNLNIVNQNTDKAHKDAQLAIERDRLKIAQDEVLARKLEAVARARESVKDDIHTAPQLAPLRDAEGNIIRTPPKTFKLAPGLKRTDAEVKAVLEKQATVAGYIADYAELDRVLAKHNVTRADLLGRGNKFIASLVQSDPEVKTVLQKSVRNLIKEKVIATGAAGNAKTYAEIEQGASAWEFAPDAAEALRSALTVADTTLMNYIGEARKIAAEGEDIGGGVEAAYLKSSGDKPLKQDAELVGEVFRPDNFKLAETGQSARLKAKRGDTATIQPANKEAEKAYDSLKYNLIKGKDEELAYQTFVGLKKAGFPKDFDEQSDPVKTTDYAAVVAARNLQEQLSKANPDRAAAFALRYRQENPSRSAIDVEESRSRGFSRGQKRLNDSPKTTSTPGQFGTGK